MNHLGVNITGGGTAGELQTATVPIDIDNNTPGSLNDVLTVTSLDPLEATWQPSGIGPADELKTLSSMVDIDTNNATQAGEVLSIINGTLGSETAIWRKQDWVFLVNDQAPSATPVATDELLFKDLSVPGMRKTTVQSVLDLAGANAVVDTRPPRADDQGVVGQHWIDTTTDRVYVLTEKNTSGLFTDEFNFWREVSFNEQDAKSNELLECINLVDTGEFTQVILQSPTPASRSDVWGVGLENVTIFTIAATTETFVCVGDRTSDLVDVFKRDGLTTTFNYVQTLDDSLTPSNPAREYGNSISGIGTNTSAFIAVMDRTVTGSGLLGNNTHIYRFNSTSGQFEHINLFHFRPSPAVGSFPDFATRIAVQRNTWGKGKFFNFTDSLGQENLIYVQGDIFNDGTGSPGDGAVLYYLYNPDDGRFEFQQIIANTIFVANSGGWSANPRWGYTLAFELSDDGVNYHLYASTRDAGRAGLSRMLWNPATKQFGNPLQVINTSIPWVGDAMDVMTRADNTGTLHTYYVSGSLNANRVYIFRDNNTSNWAVLQNEILPDETRVVEFVKETGRLLATSGTQATTAGGSQPANNRLYSYDYDGANPTTTPFVASTPTFIGTSQTNTTTLTYNNGDLDQLTRIFISAGTQGTEGFVELFIPKLEVRANCTINAFGNNITNAGSLQATSITAGTLQHDVTQLSGTFLTANGDLLQLTDVNDNNILKKKDVQTFTKELLGLIPQETFNTITSTDRIYFTDTDNNQNPKYVNVSFLADTIRSINRSYAIIERIPSSTEESFDPILTIVLAQDVPQAVSGPNNTVTSGTEYTILNNNTIKVLNNGNYKLSFYGSWSHNVAILLDFIVYKNGARFTRLTSGVGGGSSQIQNSSASTFITAAANDEFQVRAESENGPGTFRLSQFRFIMERK